MKAICKKDIFNCSGERYFVVKAGDVVNYEIKNNLFVINGFGMNSAKFFANFKAIDGTTKMSYSDFKYILCNYIFEMAVLFPEEYNGVRSLIIQNWTDTTIMINVNKSEDVIRISYPDCQEIYHDYEAALNAIQNHNKKTA